MQLLQNLARVILLPTLILLPLMGCKDEQHTRPKAIQLPIAQVSVTEAKLITADNQVEIMGTIQAVHRAEIAAKLSGSIVALPVVLGSEVERGDLLVEISAGEITAQLQQSQAQLEQARRNLAREKKLLEKRAATAETVKSLAETLRIAEASYREAQIIQEYTRILAPFDGRITRKMANVGDLATPGKPLLQMEDEKQLQVITDIPEAMLLQVHQGDMLPVHIPAATLTITGTVAEVAPTADPLSRTAPVKLDIAPHPHLRSGQFARVSLSADTASTLAVPAEAILPFGQMERLYVVDKGIARLRLVRSGAVHNGQVEILSGLKPGEMVVIQGQQNLRDGQPVSTN